MWILIFLKVMVITALLMALGGTILLFLPLVIAIITFAGVAFMVWAAIVLDPVQSEPP